MAWRPNEYLIEGELDNTMPGRVTGWMRFAGLPERVTLDLKGNFHRDIRGAKIRFRGDCTDPTACEGAAEYMEGFALQQTGVAGDITAGREPVDYSRLPYFEWYSKENGRVVVEVDYDQVEIIGRPIPAIESDPISRTEQNEHMAQFLGELSGAVGVAALAPAQGVISDPRFTHWIVQDAQIIGEARTIQSTSNGCCMASVRYFTDPAHVHEARLDTTSLRPKGDAC